MRFQHVCFLFLGILFSCAQKATVEPVSTSIPKGPEFLIAINDEPIYSDEFLQTLSKNQHLKKNNGQLSKQEFEQNFKLFLEFQLKVKEAEKRGMDQTEEFKNEYHLIKEDLKKPYLIKNAIQEGELRKAYSRMQEIVKASHILIQIPPNASQADSLAVLNMAKNLKTKAENGADFNELSFEYSDDPSAKNNYGNLGYFTALQMVYAFEDAAYGLKIGEISEPVLTDFGVHIIKLEDRKPNPGEIRVSHILVRTDPADPLSETRAKNRIAEIFSALREDEDSWNEITLNYSEDQGTKKNGGKLPWFGVGAIVPEFERTAFSLTKIGEIAAPVKTPYGYHIIRLEETKPIASFEDMEEALKSKILRDSRSGLIQSQVMAIQMERYGFIENDTLIGQLEPLADKLLPLGQGNLEKALGEENLLNANMMVIQGDSISVREFMDFIGENKESVRPGSQHHFDSLYIRFKERTLNLTEENDLLANNEEFRSLAKEYKDGILLFSLMNELVWQKALMDSLGQMAYYEKHSDRYQWPERVPGLLVRMAKNEQMDKVRKFLNTKVYSKNLKPRLEDRFLNDFPLLFTVEEDSFVIEGHPILQKIDSDKNYHELVHEGNSHFIVLGEKIPAGPKKFEETRGKVIQDYQKYLDSTLVETLKVNNSIQINEVEKERISRILVN
jgi:peptidyl-prolyl cis-trans isomerase SurA